MSYAQVLRLLARRRPVFPVTNCPSAQEPPPNDTLLNSNPPWWSYPIHECRSFCPICAFIYRTGINCCAPCPSVVSRFATGLFLSSRRRTGLFPNHTRFPSPFRMIDPPSLSFKGLFSRSPTFASFRPCRPPAPPPFTPAFCRQYRFALHLPLSLLLRDFPPLSPLS